MSLRQPEATRVPGRNKLILTGQLGEVMKESAQAALTLIKARAADLAIDPGLFERSDVHIHVPAGAIPKDGPSAGIAMFVALASLMTGCTVRSDIAMTGEISLRGLVLPIGGVKEKVLAAARAGISTVMLPARNRKDLEDVPEDARKQVKFVWLERVDDAIAGRASRRRSSRRPSGHRRYVICPRPTGGTVGLTGLVAARSCIDAARKIRKKLMAVSARPTLVSDHFSIRARLEPRCRRAPHSLPRNAIIEVAAGSFVRRSFHRKEI
jgi:hypothetical protein